MRRTHRSYFTQRHKIGEARVAELLAGIRVVNSDRANITGVAAPAAATLEVRWVNPSNPNGKIFSSKAIAQPAGGDSKINCCGSTVASSATNCSLTGLRNFTKYEVWVLICTEPRDVSNESLNEEVYLGTSERNCTATSRKVKWTIPTAPDPATITVVAAPAIGTLEVRWANPSKENGNLSSSRSIARTKVGDKEVICNGTTEAEANCSLTGLRNFTEYEVLVEVCTAPAKVEVQGDVPGGGCTNSSVKKMWTIPTASDRANITGVTAPAAGTLEVRWVNPSKANCNWSSSRAIAQSTDGGSKANCWGSTVASSATKCSLTGLRDFTEYGVYVVICTGASGGACAATSIAVKWTIPTAPDPAKITAVAVPAAGTLEVCWANPSKANGILSSSTAMARLPSGSIEATCYETAEASSATKCWLTGLRDFTEYDVMVEVCTAPEKVEVGGDVPGGGCTNSSSVRMRTLSGAETVGTSTGLIVGVTFACLVVLAVVLFVVFWMRRRRTARSPPAKPEDFSFDPSKSHADIEPQYHSQTQYELASQQDGVYDREDEVDVGGPNMNVFVDMPSLSCLKTNMPSQQPPTLPPRTPEEVHHPACMNLPGSTDALSKGTAPNVSLSANRLENAVMREGAGDVPQGRTQASAVTPASGKRVLPPRPLLD
ncbi:hypothetical protein SprV_0802628600 [Sparganum proliferum]